MGASRADDAGDPSRGRDIIAGDFMWMGAIDLIDGRRLYPYKHTDTWRYLRLNREGHAYALFAGDYRLDAAPADAIDDLRLPGLVDDPTIDQLSVSNAFVGGNSLVP